jgi:hypothetical protein
MYGSIAVNFYYYSFQWLMLIDFLLPHLLPHPHKQPVAKLRKQETGDNVDSDDDRPFTDVPDLSKDLPQASDKTAEILDQALAGMSSRCVTPAHVIHLN